VKSAVESHQFQDSFPARKYGSTQVANTNQEQRVNLETFVAVGGTNNIFSSGN
jgi:hypothetical protein